MRRSCLLIVAAAVLVMLVRPANAAKALPGMRDRPPDPRSAPSCSEPAFSALTIGLFMTFNPKDASRTETFSEACAELRSHARFTGKKSLRGSQSIEHKSSGHAKGPGPLSCIRCQGPTHRGAKSIQSP